MLIAWVITLLFLFAGACAAGYVSWMFAAFSGWRNVTVEIALTGLGFLAFGLLLYHPAGFAHAVSWALGHLLPPNPLKVFR